jgi:hypothetical protein
MIDRTQMVLPRQGLVGGDHEPLNIKNGLTILRVGVLSRATEDEFCIVRNLNTMGARLSVFHFHVRGERIQLTLGSDEQICGRVTWIGNGEILVSFDSPINVNESLLSATNGAFRRRPPRLVVSAIGHVKRGVETFKITTLNASGGGVKVLSTQPLVVGDILQVVLEGLSTHDCTVCWSLDHHAGLAFHKNLPIPELSRWVNTRRAA